MRKGAVRDLISVHPSEFATDETMFDKLVRMQHFGLPTRLLDVSRNALVALYFATDPGLIAANRVTAWSQLSLFRQNARSTLTAIQ